MSERDLNDYMYVIRANRKENLYISFTNLKNTYIDRIEHCTQNKLEFALYFNEKNFAEQFLQTYLEVTPGIKPENNKYYEILCLNVTDVDNGIFLFGVPCYFSGEAFKKWRKAPHDYSIKKTFNKYK